MIDCFRSGKRFPSSGVSRVSVLLALIVTLAWFLDGDTRGAIRQTGGGPGGSPGQATASGPNGAGGPASPRYVGEQGGALYEAPGDVKGIRTARLMAGTPVRVTEDRGEWARVILWGWVRTADLVGERPTEAWESPGPQPRPGEAAAGVPEARPGELPDAPDAKGPAGIDLVLEPELDEAGRPIVDPTKATRITVVTYAEPAPERSPDTDEEGPAAPGAGIGVSIGLIDLHGRLVAWEKPTLDFGLTLWEKRPAPGGYVRGRKLYVGSVALANWKDGVFAASRKCRIDYVALEATDPDPADRGILVVHVRLPDGRVIFGRDYEVGLAPPSDS